MTELKSSQNFLITVGAGFIGSNFITYFLENNSSCSVIKLDKLTYAGALNNLFIANKIWGLVDALWPKKSGSYSEQIAFIPDRPGHDYRYAINSTKIESEHGWRALESFESGLEKTVHWYLNKYNIL